MGKAQREKGHRYERQLRSEMIELGFKDCETSRYESKKLDDAKVDLTNTGCFNIQAKFYDSNQPNFRKVLGEMPNDDKHNVVFHKTRYKEDIVVMHKKDFYEIIKKLI